MTALPKPLMDRGFKLEARPLPVAQRVELFGHVTLVEGYAVPGFVGCHALVALRDTPRSTVAVMTTVAHLQSLLATVLATSSPAAASNSPIHRHRSAAPGRSMSTRLTGSSCATWRKA